MISGQSASSMSCTAATLIRQPTLKSASKDGFPLPSSCHGRKPQKTRSCRQRLGVRRTSFTWPPCSSIFRNGLDAQRCKQIRNSSWARTKLNGQMAAGISNSMWGKDETNQTVPPRAQEESQLFWTGPLPGDLAEVEAFCQIFRAAEKLYTAIMDTLCNPDMEECEVTYILEPVNFMSGDVLELEEKVVAGLGCMAALLHRGRQAVLAGRSSNMNLFRASDSNVVDDKLPPLAIFRAEMKTCCEKLQSALECYFPPAEERSADIWRRLQQLKNVCYDAGFRRGEGSPCQKVLPNWAAVSLRPGEGGRMLSDEQVAFWRGGQVTEEGLTWLLDNGYKTIVDLRAEGSKEKNNLAAIGKAVSSGRIQLVHLPVPVGNAPTREQVEKFATLVSNHESRPLYLHSQEGVWRTSAMVSRWRELVLQNSSHLGSDRMSKGCGILPTDFRSLEKDADGKVLTTDLELQDSKLEDGLRPLNSGNGSVLKVQGSNHGLHEHTEMESSLCSDFITDKHDTESLAYVVDSNEDQKSKRGRDEEEGDCSLQESLWPNSPFEAQRPTCNVLSKKEMREFLKNRKISPKTFIDHRINRSKVSPVSSISDTWESVQNCETAEAAGHWGMVVQPGIIREASSCEDLGPTSMGVISTNEQAHSYQNPVSLDVGRNGTVKSTDESNKSSVPKSETSSIKDGGLSDGNGPSSDKEIQNGTFVRPSLASPPDDSDDSESINGNMCASTTGVVRVQSRKKAEMYLVRTDGFSCARERVRESSLAFTHPSTQQQMLMWKTPPKTVLLLKKLGKELMEEAQQVASFLYHQERMNVVVEPEVHDTFARLPGFGFVQTFYIQDTSDLHERVDFVACLGGDGVILHASNLFQGAVPPVVSFNLGSLGFLTAHRFADYKLDLRAIIHGNTLTDGVYITLRMRLCCEILRNGKAMPGKVFSVLNEVVVDRGSSPYLCKIECYEHNNLITKVQADGIIVATPTGSTAYSTSAGGSMVHPNVPCMLFTPICPHSLSFRPVILPDSAKLELKIPDDARSNAWVSFDGQRRQQLSKGDSVRICMSEHPLPTVNKCDQTGDWFRSLVRCLNWNERLEQKALIV